jgi:hypothetical protein
VVIVIVATQDSLQPNIRVLRKTGGLIAKKSDKEG